MEVISKLGGLGRGAGLGILGVIFGLAIQDWLKDIIRGSSILSDNYFAVGDVVKYKDIEGKVLVIEIKTGTPVMCEKIHPIT